jgi:hypothetical protein
MLAAEGDRRTSPLGHLVHYLSQLQSLVRRGGSARDVEKRAWLDAERAVLAAEVAVAERGKPHRTHELVCSSLFRLVTLDVTIRSFRVSRPYIRVSRPQGSRCHAVSSAAAR